MDEAYELCKDDRLRKVLYFGPKNNYSGRNMAKKIEEVLEEKPVEKTDDNLKLTKFKFMNSGIELRVQNLERNLRLFILAAQRTTSRELRHRITESLYDAELV